MAQAKIRADERPIGYWLKHLDSLIETAFERELSEQNLTRRHWQILNVLKTQSFDESGLTSALRPFWSEGTGSPADTIRELERGRLISQGTNGRFALTRDGEAAHASLEKRVQAIRSLLTDGVSAQDYQTTLRVLQKMSDNLAGTYEWSA